MLRDSFGRQVNYVRMSVTDRCDLRCQYCMSEQMNFLPRQQILTLEEIERIARVFVRAGVRKIRITGGEPMVRKGVISLLENLGKLKNQGLEELVLTTNGMSLVEHAAAIRQAGVSRLNISLDSLVAERFKSITRVGDLEKVLKGIQAAKAQGFERIKLNSVLMKGWNEDECLDLLKFAIAHELDISFIEEMPLGAVNHERKSTSVSSDEIEEKIRKSFFILPLKSADELAGPARRFSVAGANSVLGLISPHSHNFCSSCNRVRLSAEGRLFLCLGHEHSVDFRELLRDEHIDDDELIRVFRKSLDIKPERHEFSLDDAPQIVRFMNMTGG